MARVAFTILDLARDSSWPEIKTTATVKLELEGMVIPMTMMSVPSKLGKMRYLACPRCGRRCRTVFTSTVAGLGCRSCLSLRHPDQLVGTRWERDVALPVRKLRRLDARLARRGLDRAVRRRLRRRRARLLLQVAHALAGRRAVALAKMSMMSGSRPPTADPNISETVPSRR